MSFQSAHATKENNTAATHDITVPALSETGPNAEVPIISTAKMQAALLFHQLHHCSIAMFTG